jgi:hypothetical protein
MTEETHQKSTREGMSRSVLIIEAGVSGFDVQAAASELSIETVSSA